MKLCRITTLLLILTLYVFLVLPGICSGKTRIIKKDTDNDEIIDRISHYDSNNSILKLELDTNKDGIMDIFQYYINGKIERIERDKNFDKKIDSVDYFQTS